MFYLGSLLTAHNSNNNCYGIHVDLSTQAYGEFALSSADAGKAENQMQYLRPDLVRQYLLTSDIGYHSSNALFGQIGVPQLCIYVNSASLPNMIRQRVDVSLTLRGTAVDTVIVTPMKNPRFSDTTNNALPVIANLTPGLHSTDNTIPAVLSQSQLPSTRPTSNLQGTPKLHLDNNFYRNDITATPVVMTPSDVNSSPQLKAGIRQNLPQTTNLLTQSQRFPKTHYDNKFVCMIGWIYWLFFGLCCAMMLTVCVLMGIHQGRLNGVITMNNVVMNEVMLVGLNGVKSIADARQFILQADAIAGQPPQLLQSSNSLDRLNAVANVFNTYTNFLSINEANSANIEFHNRDQFTNVSCLDTILNIPNTLTIDNYTPQSITAQSITAQNAITSDFVNANTSMVYTSVSQLTVGTANIVTFESNGLNLGTGTAGSGTVTTNLTGTNLVSQNTIAVNYTAEQNLTSGTTGGLQYQKGTISGATVATNTFTVTGQGNPTQTSNTVFDNLFLKNNGAMRFRSKISSASLTCTGKTLILNGTLRSNSTSLSALQGAATAQLTNVPTVQAPSVSCTNLTAQTLNSGSLASANLNSGTTTLNSLTSTFLGFDDQQFVANKLSLQFTGQAAGQINFNSTAISSSNLVVNGLTSAMSASYGPDTTIATIDQGTGGTITSGSITATSITANSYIGLNYNATGTTAVNGQFSVNKITAGSFAIQNGTQVFNSTGISVDYLGSTSICQMGINPVTKC